MWLNKTCNSWANNLIALRQPFNRTRKSYAFEYFLICDIAHVYCVNTFTFICSDHLCASPKKSVVIHGHLIDRIDQQDTILYIMSTWQQFIWVGDTPPRRNIIHERQWHPYQFPFISSPNRSRNDKPICSYKLSSCTNFKHASSVTASSPLVGSRVSITMAPSRDTCPKIDNIDEYVQVKNGPW